MQDRISPVIVVESIKFKKDIKKLGKANRLIKEDIKSLIEQLEAGETPGDCIIGNKYPVYKVRVRNSTTNRGKSGGYRIIYYTVTLEAILLTTIYAKSDRENISNQEIEKIIEQEDLKYLTEEIASPEERLEPLSTENQGQEDGEEYTDN
ncbi:type II toxin-antitoxin system RelE/ParE family toxin [Chamaesiphon polymorphus]|uniref:type II toxin-antitoxin system RelE/ParE family toxin n=1 Tax=Chamaesiphon polymorphus TaxID=2107691 RepID=UPI0015E637E0|nr:type II toxin-antitoxin system RelE/ParE family toxin [Chamaesiphon polymorphus]